MARLVTTGFEWQAIDDGAAGRVENPFFRTVNAPTIDTTVKRSGAASLKCQDSATLLIYARFSMGTEAVRDRDYYARAYVRLSDATPGANTSVFQLQNATTPTTQLTVRVAGTTGLVTLRDTAGALSGSYGPLTDNTWYCFEVRYRVNSVDGTAGNAELRITADTPGAVPTVVASSIGGANLGTLNPDRIHWGGAGGAARGDIWVDDVAWNDDQTGGDETGYPGPGKVVLLKPVSDYQRDASWLNGTGGTSNLYQGLDNTPPTGKATGSAGATDQIKNVATVNNTDTYTAETESYASKGIVSTDRIKVVQGVMALGADTASAFTAYVSLVDGNPTVGEGGLTTAVAAATYPVGWLAARGLVSYAPSLTLGSGAHVRVRKNDLGDLVHVSLLGVYVEYAPQLTQDPADTATASDATSLEAGPGLADTATASDSRALDVGQVQADTVSASDALSIEAGLSQADTATASDSQSLEAGLGVADSVTATDALTTADEAVIGDSVAVSDAQTLEVTTEQADTVTASDGFNSELYTDVSLSDSVTASDSQALEVQLSLGDSVTVTDGVVSIPPPGQQQDASSGVGWVLPSQPKPRPREHLFALADFVTASDRLKVESSPDPDLQREEELVLALLF